MYRPRVAEGPLGEACVQRGVGSAFMGSCVQDRTGVEGRTRFRREGDVFAALGPRVRPGGARLGPGRTTPTTGVPAPPRASVRLWGGRGGVTTFPHCRRELVSPVMRACRSPGPHHDGGAEFAKVSKSLEDAECCYRNCYTKFPEEHQRSLDSVSFTFISVVEDSPSYSCPYSYLKL